MTPRLPCARCHREPAWSSKLCWGCHRAYAAALRADPQSSVGVLRGLVVGVATVAGALGAGAPGFVAIAIVPIAMAFGTHAARKHRRAWIARTQGALPEARLIPSGRGTDTGR